jgi:hypothetical protein
MTKLGDIIGMLVNFQFTKEAHEVAENNSPEQVDHRSRMFTQQNSARSNRSNRSKGRQAE